MMGSIPALESQGFRNRIHVMSNNLFAFVLMAAALLGLAYLASSLVSPFG
jgi:hypothetical protein